LNDLQPPIEFAVLVRVSLIPKNFLPTLRLRSSSVQKPRGLALAALYFYFTGFDAKFGELHVPVSYCLQVGYSVTGAKMT